MRVLFVGLARTIWLFDLNLINPTGLSLQGVIEGIGARYQFAKFPKNIMDVDKDKSLEFKAGTFTNSQGTSVLVSLNIHLDGMVVDTNSSTDNATEFLVDLSDWMAREHHLVFPPEVRVAYVSQLDVECDVSLMNLNPKLAGLLKFLESKVKPSDGKRRRFDVGGLSFWTEDVTQLGAPAVVKFERKFKTAFSDNHYFSQAPLQTRAHIDMLGELEALLKA